MKKIIKMARKTSLDSLTDQELIQLYKLVCEEMENEIDSQNEIVWLMLRFNKGQ